MVDVIRFRLGAPPSLPQNTARDFVRDVGMCLPALDRRHDCEDKPMVIVGRDSDLAPVSVPLGHRS